MTNRDDGWRGDEELARALEELAPALDRFDVPDDAPDDLVARTMRRARGQLLAPARPAAAEAAPAVVSGLLPQGFGRELLRLLGLTAPVAFVSGAWALFLFEQLPAWLGLWLPASLASGATGAWALAAATLASLTYGSLPFFAHGRAQAKLEEVPS